VLSETALRVGTPSVEASPGPTEQLRVLRAGRRILLAAPDTKVALALNQAAGRGHSRTVWQAINRLDEITLAAYQTSFFDFEETPAVDSARIVGILDRAIADLESARDRRAATRSTAVSAAS
jgi:hypothetical protein